MVYCRSRKPGGRSRGKGSRKSARKSPRKQPAKKASKKKAAKKGSPREEEGNPEWIKGAIKHPGALHRELGIPEGEKIPAKELAAAAKKGGKLGRRARLARTLNRLRKHRGDGK